MGPAIEAESQYAAPPGGLHNPLNRADALWLQGRLHELGFYSGNTDGVWGLSSRAALQAFKRQNGLPPDDSWNAATESKLTDPAHAAERPNVRGSLGGAHKRMRRGRSYCAYQNQPERSGGKGRKMRFSECEAQQLGLAGSRFMQCGRQKLGRRYSPVLSWGRPYLVKRTRHGNLFPLPLRNGSKSGASLVPLTNFGVLEPLLPAQTPSGCAHICHIRLEMCIEFCSRSVFE